MTNSKKIINSRIIDLKTINKVSRKKDPKTKILIGILVAVIFAITSFLISTKSKKTLEIKVGEKKLQEDSIPAILKDSKIKIEKGRRLDFEL